MRIWLLLSVYSPFACLDQSCWLPWHVMLSMEGQQPLSRVFSRSMTSQKVGRHVKRVTWSHRSVFMSHSALGVNGVLRKECSDATSDLSGSVLG